LSNQKQVKGRRKTEKENGEEKGKNEKENGKNGKTLPGPVHIGMGVCGAQ
jgi:hypothetical protein